MDWDDHSLKNATEADEQDKISGVLTALGMMDGALPAPNVWIETSPKKRVFVLQDFKAGELIILPRSKKAIVDKSDDTDGKSLRIKTQTVTAAGKHVCIVPEPMTTAKEMGPKRPMLLEPFWCVDRCTDEITSATTDKNNVKLSNVRVIGACAMRVNAEEVTKTCDCHLKFEVNIPVMTNVKERTSLDLLSLNKIIN